MYVNTVFCLSMSSSNFIHSLKRLVILKITTDILRLNRCCRVQFCTTSYTKSVHVYGRQLIPPAVTNRNWVATITCSRHHQPRIYRQRNSYINWTSSRPLSRAIERVTRSPTARECGETRGLSLFLLRISSPACRQYGLIFWNALHVQKKYPI